jgi:hypothetical protein
LTKGEATWSDDLLLVVERNNYREEAYFTYSYSTIPLRRPPSGSTMMTHGASCASSVKAMSLF